MVKLTSDQYVSKVNNFMHNGLDKDIPECPACGADFESWREVGPAFTQDPYSRQKLQCDNCKAMWVTEYKLVGYYDLQEVKQN